MGLFDDAAALVRRLPAGELPARALELYGRGLGAIEGAALRMLAARLDAAAPERRQLAAAATRAVETPSQLMGSLLSRSLQSNTAGSRQDFYTAVLRQLLPDEARILAALADGPAAPLVSVYKRGGGEVLEYASQIGRTAAVTLPSMTPKYVAHLLELGLVEIGPEDMDNKHGYELVLAEREVRDALKEGELSKLPARVRKGTVRLSAHGRDLWNATRPEGSVE